MLSTDTGPHVDYNATAPSLNTPRHESTMPPGVDTTRKFSQRALIQALDREDLERVRSLHDSSRTTIVDKEGNTALHYAATRSAIKLNFVEQLISLFENKNEYVTTKNKSGRTALHLAAKMGNLGIIEPLINHAQNKDEYVTTKDHLDCTALHCAAETKNANVMELLISHAKNKDEYIAAGNSSQKTALHCAAQLGRLETVKILFTLSEIASSECINRQCSDGRTPLHYAALAPKNGEVIFFLLQQRADPQLQDKDGNAAWDITLRPRKARSKSSSKKKTLDKGIPDKEIPRDEMDWGNIAAFVLYASDPERSPEEIAEEINEESFEDSSEDNSKQNSEQRRAVDTLDSNMLWTYERLCPIAIKIASRLEEAAPGGNIKTLTRIFEQIDREFHESPETPRCFRSREPSCIVQPLEITSRDDPRWSKVSGDGGRLPYGFVSLVVPYIGIGNSRIEYLTQTANVGNDDEISKGSMPLTLDRYCRPVLPEEVLEVRDQDQVPGRYTNPSPEESSKQPWSGNCLKLLGELLILMKAYIKNIRHPIDSKKVSRLAAVAQLAQATKLVRNGVVFVRQAWIWKIDGAIIVHSDENASRWDFDRPSITVRGKGPISLDGGQLPFPPSEPLSRLVWILGNIVEGYDEPSVSTRWNEVFLAYSNALSFISEDVNEYAKKARIEDIDLGKEKQLFHEIGDLREELSMIKSVFAEQEKVINEFLVLVPKDKGFVQLADDRKRMLRIRTMFNKRRQRIANLEEDAERVERNVSVQLDLKQKHATIREAHSLAVLSATVFGFTVITVIFAPLSFIVALFALPIDRFNEGKYGSNKDGVYSSGYIGKWSAATELVSISVTLGAMWAALRFTGLHIWGKKGLREYIGQKVNEARAAEGGARTTDVENAQVTGSRGSWEHSRTG